MCSLHSGRAKREKRPHYIRPPHFSKSSNGSLLCKKSCSCPWSHYRPTKAWTYWITEIWIPTSQITNSHPFRCLTADMPLTLSLHCPCVTMPDWSHSRPNQLSATWLITQNTRSSNFHILCNFRGYAGKGHCGQIMKGQNWHKEWPLWHGHWGDTWRVWCWRVMCSQSRHSPGRIHNEEWKGGMLESVEVDGRQKHTVKWWWN